jgi:ubiquinol-cytochrome c reductase cytochrome b subunit
MAKAGGFFFIVFGIVALLSGLVNINPIWIFGPYTPDQVTAGTQPDWYIGWLDGALRLMPNWETVIAGFTISWNVFIPSVVIPGILFTGLAFYPFLEAWATGDKREHNLLDRPRNAPVRTGIGVMAIVFYGILWFAGGNDLVATTFDLSINAISWTLRVLLIVAPPLAFIITKRTCLSLQRRDRDKLLHGYESGRILRLPHGEFVEVHQPLNEKELAVISSKPDTAVLPAPEKSDTDGVRNPRYLVHSLQHRLSAFFYGDNIPRPTAAEIEAGQHHVGDQAAVEAPLHEYEEQDVIVNAHGGVLHHPGMATTNADQITSSDNNT